MRYPFVLLDIGETLIEPRRSYGAVYAEALARHGVDVSATTLDRAIAGVARQLAVEIPAGVDRFGHYEDGEAGFWRRFCERVLQSTGRNDAIADGVLATLDSVFSQPETWCVYPEVKSTLERLRGDGVRLAVVSNWDSRLPALLERLDLASYFETMLVSHVEGVEKPDPVLFERALERLGARPAEALHVGNAPEFDLAGARAAGIAGLLVDRRGVLAPEHGAAPDLSGLPAIARDGLVG